MHGPRGHTHSLTKVWQVLAGDHNKLPRLRVSGKLVGGRDCSPHGRGEAWSHALVQGRVTKSWKKKHTVTTQGMQITRTHVRSCLPCPNISFSFPCDQAAVSLGAQQHLSLHCMGVARAQTHHFPPGALTVGMAGQPHGGAPGPGEPGVGCQVRSRVCRPAPRARQAWASCHHEVGVQTVRGAARGVYPGKICQLLALSGDGGGKRERWFKHCRSLQGWRSLEVWTSLQNKCACKPGSDTPGQPWVRS